MTKNPFYNALGALGYVIFVTSVLRLGEYLGSPDTPDNFFIPIGMLSLFVLSAAVMAYIFLYQPITLLLDGKRTEAVRLFVHTVAVFAGFTIIALSIAMFLV